jgi:2,4-dienoyl-CoA reductase-like NADH-dependent reductase (Old Yellow Enzyme family)
MTTLFEPLQVGRMHLANRVVMSVACVKVQK